MKTKVVLALLILAGFLNFVRIPAVEVLLLFTLFGAAVWVFLSDKKTSSKKSTDNEELDERTYTSEEAESSVAIEKVAEGTEVLTSLHINREWIDFENTISEILHKVLVMVQEQFHPTSVALFMPDANGAYRLRSHITNSEHFVADAMVIPGEGFLGTYCKEGFPELILGDVGGRKLPHYGDRNGGVNSLMVAPVGAVKASAFVLVDSTEKNGFTKENLDWLVDMGNIAGQLLYYSYLYKQHQMLHEQVNAIALLEKRLLMIEDKGELLDELVKSIVDLFPFNRCTISIVPDEHVPNAVISRISGEEGVLTLDEKYQLVDGSLSHICFYNQQPLARNLNVGNEYIFTEKESKSSKYASFAALPVGRMNGLLILESASNGVYTPAIMDTLSRIVMVAGVALDKIRVLEQQENLAIRDGLTGLYNHRQFQHLLREAIARSHRMVFKSTQEDNSGGPYGTSEEKRPLSLVLCDIDHFKLLNDNHGHRFGDEVLREIAATLDKGVREGVDCAARYGGEEFALVLFDSDGAQAAETANRIRSKIESISFKTPTGGNITVTMSFGVAVYDKDARQQEDLIQKADKALYKAKEKGRNRVEQFGVGSGSVTTQIPAV